MSIPTGHRPVRGTPIQDSPADQKQGVRLSQVYAPKNQTEAEVDIIAIHGLDTKSPDTWT